MASVDLTSMNGVGMEFFDEQVNAPVEGYWKAVKIYHDRPNSINKQVLYAENLGAFKLCRQPSDLKLLVGQLEKKIDKESVVEILRDNALLDDFAVDEDIFSCASGIFMTVRKLIPKSSDYSTESFYEFCVIDLLLLTVTFMTKWVGHSTDLNLLIILKYKKMEISFMDSRIIFRYNSDMPSKGLNWIKLFVEKFKKLMTNNMNKTQHLKFKEVVSPVKYYQLYDKLKKKYGKYLVDNWSENTDPKKFVYEDIGIATYLILLWNNGEFPDENSKKINFVDLGCGNGLLVYILNSEGHNGVGLDIRKRKIWDFFPDTVKLKVETIIPSLSCVYPEADWLIGNHSDELTAWIPIMANRSNSSCQYFVLPCCPYTLNGKNYQRKNSSLSSYQDFMSYVEKISQICGFDTFFDKLRIPSTKRICLIGFRGKESRDDAILKFVNEECRVFEPRDSVEPVRNCTKLPKKIVDEILILIMKDLLVFENFIEVGAGGKVRRWNLGRELPVGDLAKILPLEYLRVLKQECKGLQTLLKNNHYIFKVSQGRVRFRDLKELGEISKGVLDKGLKWKMKKCWLFSNHPDGCPLDDEYCSYKHEN